MSWLFQRCAHCFNTNTSSSILRVRQSLVSYRMTTSNSHVHSECFESTQSELASLCQFVWTVAYVCKLYAWTRLSEQDGTEYKEKLPSGAAMNDDTLITVWPTVVYNIFSLNARPTRWILCFCVSKPLAQLLQKVFVSESPVLGSRSVAKASTIRSAGLETAFAWANLWGGPF